MPRIIALTGATGFIGGVTVRKLGRTGFKLRALVRPASDRRNLADIEIQWIPGSLEDIESLRRLLQGADVVIHCAGAVRGASYRDFEQVNVHGVARLVQVANEQQPLPRFLLLSSLAAREPALSPYAASKRQGEQELAGAAGQMRWMVLRPPAVYGPGDRELRPFFRWMMRGVAPIIGPPGARLSMLYVDDLAGAVLQWVSHGNGDCGVFELHDGQPGGYSWEDIVRTVERLRGERVLRIRVPGLVLRAAAELNLLLAGIVGYAPMLTPGKIRELKHPDWVCNNNALSRRTGWTPQITLEEGLRRTLTGASGAVRPD